MPVAVVFLPLLGAVLAGVLAFVPSKDSHAEHQVDRLAQLITCGALLLSMAAAIVVFIVVVVEGNARTTLLFTWIASGDFRAEWALKVDSLTAVMMIVVTVVSAMVHVYSIGYMHHDHSIPRFMAYLNLFTFFMLMLITADNLLQLFFGWEGVGLSSYLLIGFWYDRPSANAAAIKAFIVNRVGDVRLHARHRRRLLRVRHQPPRQHVRRCRRQRRHDGLGVRHRSARDHPDLPVVVRRRHGQVGADRPAHVAAGRDGGPDPRLRPDPRGDDGDRRRLPGRPDVALVRVLGYRARRRHHRRRDHVLLRGDDACVQNDIKRVIAYSTCSQLGYMFFALGVSAYAAGIFHLTTHACFKALLFLGSGSVIHAMSDEQDMRKMGGLWKLIPATYVLMWIGALALAGIWPFAGYWSKDTIIESAFAADTGVGLFAFWAGVAAAFMTAFYSWRLLLMTFHGKPRAEESVMARVHESPLVMLVPMSVLAVGAVFAGWIGYRWFVGADMDAFWHGALFVLPQHAALEEAHHVPGWVKLLPLSVGIAGIVLAYVMYMFVPGLPARIAGTFRPVYLFLLNKWYFDELYDRLFVRPSFAIGRGFWKGGDGQLIDGLGPDGVAATALRIARGATRLQTGYIFHYAFAMLIGILILVSWYLLRVMG